MQVMSILFRMMPGMCGRPSGLCLRALTNCKHSRNSQIISTLLLWINGLLFIWIFLFQRFRRFGLDVLHIQLSSFSSHISSISSGAGTSHGSGAVTGMSPCHPLQLASGLSVFPPNTCPFSSATDRSCPSLPPRPVLWLPRSYCFPYSNSCVPQQVCGWQPHKDYQKNVMDFK